MAGMRGLLFCTYVVWVHSQNGARSIEHFAMTGWLFTVLLSTMCCPRSSKTRTLRCGQKSGSSGRWVLITRVSRKLASDPVGLLDVCVSLYLSEVSRSPQSISTKGLLIGALLYESRSRTPTTLTSTSTLRIIGVMVSSGTLSTLASSTSWKEQRISPRVLSSLSYQMGIQVGRSGMISLTLPPRSLSVVLPISWSPPIDWPSPSSLSYTRIRISAESGMG
mmetsp:Transcript_16620/g.33485  ORF Transcript_16620/g.33485 Transcript_16620/m.33485 type:complete len:221 (+) Transcript_16620:2357-3019(+)